MAKPTVFVAMPSWTGFPYPEVLLNIFNQTCKDDVNLIFSQECIAQRMPIHDARNWLVNIFLTKTKAEYIWFVDDDNPPALDVLENLLKADKDVCSAIVPLRKIEHTNIFVGDKHKDVFYKEDGDYQEIDNFGTWCVLMKREFMKHMYKHTNAFPYQFKWEQMVHNIESDKVEPYEFQDKYIKDWKKKYANDGNNIIIKHQYVSEDINFGRVAKQLGYKFWVSIYSTCYHFVGDSEIRKLDKRNLIVNRDSNT